jgi:SAM-dependent methyltransferase
MKMAQVDNNRPSLENLIENENLGVEILHPGGLEITNELALMCQVGKETTVLDVASGTGESACYLAEHFGCHVVGVDASDYMIERAKQKAAARGLYIEFHHGDAHELPFDDNTLISSFRNAQLAFWTRSGDS